MQTLDYVVRYTRLCHLALRRLTRRMQRLLALFLLLSLPIYGIGTNTLPAASTVLPKKILLLFSYADGGKDLILCTLLVLVAQSLTITGLIITRRRKLAAEKRLVASEDQFRIRLGLSLEHNRRYEDGLELLLDLNQHSGDLTEQKICDRTVDIVVMTTTSEFGYLHLFNDDLSEFSADTWNAEALRVCAYTSGIQYPLDAVAIWADCIRTHRPVIHNDYQNILEIENLPDGHAPLLRHMSVPVLEGDRVRMIVGVGNKASDYVADDARQLYMVASQMHKILMRRGAEDALYESNARFRFITDLSPALVWVANTAKLGVWVNKTWLDFSGRSMEQMLGARWIETVHPDDRETCLATFSNHFDARTPFSQEMRVRRRDGEYRWMLNSGQPRIEANGEFNGYVGAALDITEQRQGEEQLTKLWLAVEQTSHSIVITDLDARIEYVNRAFSEISGYSSSEVLGRNPRILQSGQTPASTYAEMWNVLEQGSTWQGEFRNKRKSGELYIEAVRISPVRQPDGRISNYLAVKEDITEQKLAMSSIRESKRLLQKVIDSSPDMIFVRDKERRFMLVNERFANAVKQTPASMIGRRDSDVLPLEMCVGSSDRGTHGIHHGDSAVFAGESIYMPSDKIILADGETHFFEASKRPLRDSSETVYGILCYRRDITERHKIEEEQVALEAQLKQAQKMEIIGHLSGGIAHDFNNILTSMFGYAELLKRSPAIKEDQKLSKYLREIIQGGIRAKELVAQLLTFSQKSETATDPINAAPIINEVVKMLRSTLPTTMSIEQEIAKVLPDVLISPVRLHQILMNLAINGRDAMKSKGLLSIRAEPVEVDDGKTCSSCHHRFSGRYLLISVRDDGSGIVEEDLLKIFDPFYTTKPVGQGTGLGLSVLHGIVHSANGHVEVLTAVDQGSEFRIYLPTQPTQGRIIHKESELDVGSIRIQGHVVVVDDEESIVAFVTALLESFGCRVTGLTSASAALRLFEDSAFTADLIITDQTMPELTGAELSRAILARRSDIPIVMMTGFSTEIDEKAAREIGIRRFLMKPVPATVLTDIVVEYLAHNQTGDR